MRNEQDIKDRIKHLEDTRPPKLMNPEELDGFISGLKWVLEI